MIYSITTITDIIIFIIIILSSFTAAWRGLTKEFTTILVWVISIILSNLSYTKLIPYTEPFLKIYIDFQLIISIINWIIPFFICLITLTIVNVFFVSKLISPINFIIDSFLGLIFGIFRGIFIVCIIYLSLIFIVGNENSLPNDIKSSYSLSITRNISTKIIEFLPKNYYQKIKIILTN